MLLACSVVTLLAVTAGCRMCAHPYDYCGPVFTGANGEPCDANVRHGSILSGGMVSPFVATTEVKAAEPATELERQAGVTQAEQAVSWTAQRPTEMSR